MKFIQAVLGCVLLSSASAACSQSTTSGKVFLDANQNRQWDAGEPGIPGVFVSNGEAIVRTDAEGQYEIGCDSACVIFVIKPAGYRFPTDDNYQPRFYYVHSPDGSPALRYGGQKKTGKLPETIHFALYEQIEAERFRIVLFGDPQPNDRRDLDYFSRDIVQELQGIQGVAFGLSLGDLVNDDLSLFAPLNRVIGSVGVPWFSLPGNHDMDLDAPDDATSDDTYESVYGPGTYAMQYGKVHFLMLDNVLYRPGSYSGGLTQQQFKFIANYLALVASEHLVILAMHIPLVDSATSFRGFDPAHRERLLRHLQRFTHTLSLSGHTHQQWHAYLDKSNGWNGRGEHHHYNVGTTSGSWWSGPPDAEGIPDATMQDGTPNGYAFLDIEGVSYSLTYRAARAPSEYQMRLHAPQVVRHRAYPNANLYANVFMGSERTRVEFRVIGHTDWATMMHAYLPDPVMAYRTALRDHSPELMPGKRVGPALNSRHLWRIGLPTHLPVGEYEVEVRAVTQWGDHFYDKVTYRLAAD